MSNKFVVHEWKSGSTVNNPTKLVISRVIFGNIREASNFYAKVATSLMISGNLWVVLWDVLHDRDIARIFFGQFFNPMFLVTKGQVANLTWQTAITRQLTHNRPDYSIWTREKHSFWLVRKTYTSNEFDHLRSGVLLGRKIIFWSTRSKNEDRRLRIQAHL